MATLAKNLKTVVRETTRGLRHQGIDSVPTFERLFSLVSELEKVSKSIDDIRIQLSKLSMHDELVGSPTFEPSRAKFDKDLLFEQVSHLGGALNEGKS